MFVIEKFRDDLDSRQKAWEHARDRWVAKNDYNYPREYADAHPSPKDKIKMVYRSVVIGLSVALVVFMSVGLAKEIKANNDKKAAEAPAIVEKPKEKDCRRFNKGDYVIIQYGYYEDSSGTIIGGCEHNEEYQVKLTKEDRVISVNTEDNLVVVDLPEKEE